MKKQSWVLPVVALGALYVLSTRKTQTQLSNEAVLNDPSMQQTAERISNVYGDDFTNALFNGAREYATAGELFNSLKTVGYIPNTNKDVGGVQAIAAAQLAAKQAQQPDKIVFANQGALNIARSALAGNRQFYLENIQDAQRDLDRYANNTGHPSYGLALQTKNLALEELQKIDAAFIDFDARAVVG